MTSSSDPFPKKIVVGVMGIPIKSGRQYLLTRRNAPGIPAWHNKWQVAGGGLEFGETPEETLVREFQEELSVTPKILHEQPIVKTSIWYAHETDIKHDAQIILIVYLVKIGDQKIDITKDDETNKYGWFTYEKFIKLDSLPMTIDVVKEAEKIIRTNKLLK